MTDTVYEKSRGRPRLFDIDFALLVGQAMFHQHGYDAVGLSAITARLGIKPPSFYAAFGSKAGFFARILDRYATTVLPLDVSLVPGSRPVEALSDLLHRAARLYAADPLARGCLALETARSSGDSESTALARETTAKRRETIRAFIAQTHPTLADSLTDFVANTLSGLSAGARSGWTNDRLVAVAAIASLGIETLLSRSASSIQPGDNPPLRL